MTAGDFDGCSKLSWCELCPIESIARCDHPAGSTELKLARPEAKLTSRLAKHFVDPIDDLRERRQSRNIGTRRHELPEVFLLMSLSSVPVPASLRENGAGREDPRPHG